MSRGYNLIKKYIDENKFKVCSKCIITNINKGQKELTGEKRLVKHFVTI